MQLGALRRLEVEMSTSHGSLHEPQHDGEIESALALEQKTADELRMLLVEAQLKLLQSRDFAIGAAARLGEYLAGRNTQTDYEVHIQNHLEHIARLEEALRDAQQQIRRLHHRSLQLDGVMSSATWKIGRVVMLPIRLMKRITRRSR